MWNNVPNGSLIKVSTYDTKSLEDRIDPLSKIVADGKTAEESKILENSELLVSPSEEVSEIEARILAEFPDARWMKKLKEGEFNKLKEIISLQETELTTHKMKPQNEPDMSQDQRNPQASSFTLIDLMGSHQNDDKVGSVSQKLKESTSDILSESQDSLQRLSTNLAHPNEPCPLNHSLEPSNMSEGHCPPAPPTVAEAYVASQHGQHLLDTLPAFSDELSPLTIFTGQARLMDIGVEQNSSNAFAEIAATNAQLVLSVNSEGMTLEGDVYIILRYPYADIRPWNALVETHSAAQLIHSSAASTHISSPDTFQIGFRSTAGRLQLHNNQCSHFGTSSLQRAWRSRNSAGAINYNPTSSVI